MYYTTDRHTAERVLIDLRNARIADPDETLACLRRARSECAGANPGDRLRIQAWASVRRLYDAYKVAPDCDLKPLWLDAIAKTDAWHESMR